MSFLNPEHLIQSGGLLLIGLIVFAESGLLIGFFLPGDTLLLSAGFFAAQGKLPLVGVIGIVIVAAIAGDNLGYHIGRRTGHRIFRKKDGIIFRQEYLERAEKFYESHGGKTVTLARFIPIVRTFAPIVAGAAKMDPKRFMIYNVAGAVIWSISVTLLGYFIGGLIPDIDKYLLPVVGIATLVTFLPTITHILGDPETRDRLFARIKQIFRR
ncbi:DedA family protein [Candidatus Saccharibacteria bacterium]|jgi:membrane-associated protein|nr:MAG: DedA family protein [Candidatus Saccharibacteria bacterium]